jgi:hypothetical protein
MDYTVPCIFQIWIKKSYKRDIIETLEPLNFQFVKKTENPDISVIRVGGKSGTIDKNIEDKCIQSHYFIKFTNNKSINDNINKLSFITYEVNNTVGPKSISKQELIVKFNSLLKD